MSELTDIVKTALPTIATMFGGPLAGLAAKFVTDKLGLPADSVQNVTAILSGMSPDKLAELKSADQEFQLKLAEMGYKSIADVEALNASVLVEVNKTMQAEAAAEHWPTYSWRPFIGFMFGAYIASMWLMPMFGKAPVVLSADLTMAIGAILGVASWFRGKMQADPNIPTINKG